MKSTDDLNEIPKTGRIGRFAKILAGKTENDIVVRIMQDSGGYGKFRLDKKAHWWKNAVERLENELGKKEAIEIMRTCGSKCCGQGQRKTAKRLMNESSSIEEFLEKLSKHGVKDGELEYKLMDGNTIIGKYNRCFCGQVKKSPELFINKTYCQCSVEFNKQLFESALEKPVEVELRQSIINGGECCEFEVKWA